LRSACFPPPLCYARDCKGVESRHSSDKTGQPQEIVLCRGARKGPSDTDGRKGEWGNFLTYGFYDECTHRLRRARGWFAITGMSFCSAPPVSCQTPVHRRGCPLRQMSDVQCPDDASEDVHFCRAHEAPEPQPLRRRPRRRPRRSATCGRSGPFQWWAKIAMAV
jgi:hypothetical protein